jgi:hypothetical protein
MAELKKPNSPADKLSMPRGGRNFSELICLLDVINSYSDLCNTDSLDPWSCDENSTFSREL